MIPDFRSSLEYMQEGEALLDYNLAEKKADAVRDPTKANHKTTCSKR